MDCAMAPMKMTNSRSKSFDKRSQNEIRHITNHMNECRMVNEPNRRPNSSCGAEIHLGQN